MPYLSAWEESVMKRSGKFTKTERNRMLLSAETRLGLKMTCTFFMSIY